MTLQDDLQATTSLAPSERRNCSMISSFWMLHFKPENSRSSLPLAAFQLQ